jgi:hypothetical protein
MENYSPYHTALCLYSTAPRAVNSVRRLANSAGVTTCNNPLALTRLTKYDESSVIFQVFDLGIHPIKREFAIQGCQSQSQDYFTTGGLPPRVPIP